MAVLTSVEEQVLVEENTQVSSLIRPNDPVHMKTVLESLREAEMKRRESYLDLNKRPDAFLYKTEISKNEDDKDVLDVSLLDKETGKEYRLSYTALKQFCEMLGVRSKLLTILEPELTKQMIDQVIERFSDLNREYLIRADGNRVRAMFSPEYKIFDNIDMIDLAAKHIGDQEVTLSRLSGNENTFSFRLLFPKMEKALKVGDPVQLGLDFVNSETGYHSLEMEHLLWVLKCTNGMVGTANFKGLRVPHKGNHMFDRGIKMLDQMLEQAEFSFEKKAGLYQRSEELIIPGNVGKEIAILAAKEHVIGKSASTAMIEGARIFDSGTVNMRQVSDIFTETAHKNYGFSSDTFKKLEYAGSDVLVNFKAYKREAIDNIEKAKYGDN